MSVLLAAADTYRAAAVEQLGDWAERAGVDIVRAEQGSDPGAVAFDAVDGGPGARPRRGDHRHRRAPPHPEHLMEELGRSAA